MSTVQIGGKTSCQSSKHLEKISPDSVLKEAFQIEIASIEVSAAPHRESIVPSFTYAPVSLEKIPAYSYQMPLVPIEEFLSMQSSLFPIQSFSLPSIKTFDLFADLPKDLIAPIAETPAVVARLQPQIEISQAVLKPSEYVSLAPSTDPNILFQQASIHPPVTEGTIVKATPTIPVPNLPQLPSLADLQTVNLSDSFDAELSFIPRTDGPGYVFALTLLPQSDLNLSKIRQNVVFLIDRSNSIQKDRLTATKHAIHRALEELNSDVYFNVIAFDTKMDKLFPTLATLSNETNDTANQFINNISLGSLFSVGDLYKALFLTIPNHVSEDELYTAILLTDGDSLSKKHTKRTLLRDWTLLNQGRVSLYTVGIDGDQNAATLDAACAMNKGKYISSSTNRGLKRKLMKLAKNIRNPIAKDVVSRAVAQNPRAHIDIHLNSSHLYLDEPYVILGTTETLDDFILFVQARLKNGWLNIKKAISFTDAKKGGESLESQWALQNAYRKYELYVGDENPDHLAEAKKLLEPFNIQSIQ